MTTNRYSCIHDGRLTLCRLLTLLSRANEVQEVGRAMCTQVCSRALRCGEVVLVLAAARYPGTLTIGSDHRAVVYCAASWTPTIAVHCDEQDARA